MADYQTDWLLKWAEYAPIKTAVKDGHTGETLSYRKLNNCANYLAYLLSAEYGMKKGDRVAVLAEFSLEYIMLFGAVQKAGFVLVPLNYRLTGPELDYMIGNCSPQLLINEEKYRSQLKGQAEADNVGHKISIESLSSQVAEATSAQSSYHFPAVDIRESDPLFILYTSGTTGFPKGCIYTHKMAFWNSINTQLRLDITAADHTLICMPPFHTGGWNVLLTPFLHHGASFTLVRKFESEEVLTLLEDEDATLFMGVPTMLRMLSETKAFQKVSLESLRYFIVGGEAMPIDLIELWQSKNKPIRQGYGLTEAGPNITSLHHDDAIRKIGSIGKPNFYVEVKLVDNTGSEVGINQEGELWINGPMVSPGYWENTEATATSIVDGWFKTGDILVRDEEGYLFVKDRIKNMFISGGENVYPAEVEKALIKHEAISEAAVIGVPDDKWGEVGKAFIVLRPNSSIDISKLEEECKAYLAKFKIPKHFEFVGDIPKTDSGKIDRKKLVHIGSTS